MIVVVHQWQLLSKEFIGYVLRLVLFIVVSSIDFKKKSVKLVVLQERVIQHI